MLRKRRREVSGRDEAKKRSMLRKRRREVSGRDEAKKRSATL
jgi:hypothetical protein